MNMVSKLERVMSRWEEQKSNTKRVWPKKNMRDEQERETERR